MTSESLKKRANEIIEKALNAARAAGADESAVIVHGGRSGLTRFARNSVIQNVETDTHSLTLAVAVGAREAGLTTDVLDDESIRQVAVKAVEMAKMYPENPEHTGPIEPVDIPEVDCFDPETANLSHLEKVSIIKKICDETHSDNLLSFGTLTTGWNYTAIGNSLGHHIWHPESVADFSLTIRTENGEGSCRENRGFHSINKIDFKELQHRCSSWASWSREAEYLEPGDYRVILTPTAAFNYLMWVMWTLGARKASEQRSALNSHFGVENPVGEKLFSSKLSIFSRQNHPDCPCVPYGPAFDMDGFGGAGVVGNVFGSGLPVEDFPIIEDGVVKHLFSSLYWARKQGVKPRAFPGLVEFAGTDKSLKQIVKETDRAILINSFWYIRFVDINNLLLTGLTRDGVFLVEDGEIKKPLKNLRFNESPLESLNKIVDVGKPQLRKAWFNNILMPPMVIDDFSFSTETAAV